MAQLQQINITLSNTAQALSALVPNLPASARYVKFHNPAAGNMAFSLDGSAPVINGNGFTIANGGADRDFDLTASGSSVPLNQIQIIGAGSQKATIAFAV